MDKNRVLALRGTLKMSQKEFGDKLGVDQVTVSRWESGKNKPSKNSIQLMENYAKKRKINIKGRLSIPFKAHK